MAEEVLSFETEVGRILQIVANSLYSNKEIFLRELISNASDACDKLRYAAITNPEIASEDQNYRVTITAEKNNNLLIVDDNGIGMDRAALISDLGTIARSGTGSFIEQLSGDDKKDVDLIGQFGVGFYSVFMVARNVEVISRQAGAKDAWVWKSEGTGKYSISEAEKETRGTTIKLTLKENAKEYLDDLRLRTIVTTYSDHITLPIELVGDKGTETINKASALWTRPQNEITDEQYSSFFKNMGQSLGEPWLTLHWRAEGMMEYTGLLFIPNEQPFDLFTAERSHRIKLYVKRVFITDNCEELVPPWLRFLRGLIDSQDLPLNVSRELLQSNPMLQKIRKALVSRVLGELIKKAETDQENYNNFWVKFGAVLKEGIYEDYENRDKLLKLARFRSTKQNSYISLADYITGMKDGQDTIYYITGDSEETLARSPQLEGFQSRDIEVLLLTDPVDEFWIPTITDWEGKTFKSATRLGADFSSIKSEIEKDKESTSTHSDTENLPEGVASLIAMIKLELGEKVKDVCPSNRLTDSPVCLVADEGDIDINLERILRQHRQMEKQVPRVLEINPTHPLVAALANNIGAEGAGNIITEAAWLFLDQARLLEGESLPDPVAFSKRLSELMMKNIST
ncbi:MAG: molecular chaperone HtpG [Rhodospirillaceae bacterium]|nr:molecular chaperone HtpG [Rhodospirillaceae bacterium]